jgi:hypothetical protein
VSDHACTGTGKRWSYLTRSPKQPA